VLRAVREVVDGREFVIISTVAWGLVPITGSIYDIVANVTESRQTSGDDEGAEEDVVDAAKKSKFRKAYEAIGGGATGTGELVATEPKRTMKPFRETKIFQVVDHISQASKIGFSVIIVDCVSLISRMMGYNPWNIMERSSKVVSKVLVTGWITLRLQTWKRYFLEKSFGKSEGINIMYACISSLAIESCECLLSSCHIHSFIHSHSWHTSFQTHQTWEN